jgi:hypothetical protein
VCLSCGFSHESLADQMVLIRRRHFGCLEVFVVSDCFHIEIESSWKNI